MKYVHQAIAAPLREECDGNDDSHPPTIPSSRDKLHPTSLFLNFLEFDGSADFVVFKLNEWRVNVSIRMVVC